MSINDLKPVLHVPLEVNDECIRLFSVGNGGIPVNIFVTLQTGTHKYASHIIMFSKNWLLKLRNKSILHKSGAYNGNKNRSK